MDRLWKFIVGSIIVGAIAFLAFMAFRSAWEIASANRRCGELGYTSMEALDGGKHVCYGKIDDFVILED